MLKKSAGPLLVGDEHSRLEQAHPRTNLKGLLPWTRSLRINTYRCCQSTEFVLLGCGFSRRRGQFNLIRNEEP